LTLSNFLEQLKNLLKAMREHAEYESACEQSGVLRSHPDFKATNRQYLARIGLNILALEYISPELSQWLEQDCPPFTPNEQDAPDIILIDSLAHEVQHKVNLGYGDTSLDRLP
jgi:hypothetical protein